MAKTYTKVVPMSSGYESLAVLVLENNLTQKRPEFFTKRSVAFARVQQTGVTENLVKNKQMEAIDLMRKFFTDEKHVPAVPHHIVIGGMKNCQ